MDERPSHGLMVQSDLHPPRDSITCSFGYRSKSPSVIRSQVHVRTCTHPHTCTHPRTNADAAISAVMPRHIQGLQVAAQFWAQVTALRLWPPSSDGPLTSASCSYAYATMRTYADGSTQARTCTAPHRTALHHTVPHRRSFGSGWAGWHEASRCRCRGPGRAACTCAAEGPV